MHPNPLPSHPIGVFDSGVGGLTVAASIARKLPHESLIYFGDTAHMPYGDKSAVAIQHYAEHITQFLISKQCKAIVIACNTASAVAYKLLLQKFENKSIIINVINPIIEEVAQYNLQKIGVIATTRTTQSKVYEQELHKKLPNLQVVSQATHSLATIIEEGLFHNKNIINALIQHYLSVESLNNIQGLILACTHYPLIKKDIENYYNKKVRIFDSNECVANLVHKILIDNNLLNKNEAELLPNHQFYVSDYTPAFEQATHLFFGKKVHLQHYPIWENELASI